MLYRVLYNIVFEDGEFLAGGEVSQLLGRSRKTITMLLARGAISEVQSPPLRVLPGWEGRAEVLEGIGIKTVVDLLVADPRQVARKINVSVTALERATDSVRRWIGVEENDENIRGTKLRRGRRRG